MSQPRARQYRRNVLRNLTNEILDLACQTDLTGEQVERLAELRQERDEMKRAIEALG